MLTSLRTYQNHRRVLQDAMDYRRGFMASLDRRIFPELPQMIVGRPEESQYFEDGQRAGIECPLAVSLPPMIHHDYPQDSQYTVPVYLGTALFLLGIGALWATRA